MNFTLLPALQSCSPDISISSQHENDSTDSDSSKSSWDKKLISNLRGCLVKDATPYHDSFSFEDSLHDYSVDLSMNEAITDEIEFEITKAYEKHDSDTASTWEESRATNDSLCSNDSIKQRCSVNHSQHSIRGHHVFLEVPSSHHTEHLDGRRPCHRVRDCYRESAPCLNQYDDVISKLTTHTLSSEAEAMQAEISRTDIEISALKDDINLYKEQLTYLQESSGPLISWDLNESFRAPKITPKKTAPLLWGNMKKFTKLHRGNKKTMAMAGALNEKVSNYSMRKQRGFFFRYEIFPQGGTPQQLINSKAVQESFRLHTKKSKSRRKVNTVSLIGQSGYFLNWDCGKSTFHGEMPINLLNRMKENSISSDITYIAVGPHLCKNDHSKGKYYYVELSNSEGWWVNFDPDFHKAVQTLPVHRVAFGNPYPGSNGMPSWIVLGKDGRAAWKGIPSHLHIMMSSRDSSLCSACEVSLGPSGSYFIKFLNGEIDYCLPASMANSCEEVEDSGGVITNIMLHVDCCGFVMRHTAIDKKRS